MSSYGSPMKRLSGHSHFVSDVVISTCGQFAVSSSWDKTLRLWDLEKGITTTRFVGHTKDVLSVAFSSDKIQKIVIKNGFQQLNFHQLILTQLLYQVDGIKL